MKKYFKKLLISLLWFPVKFIVTRRKLFIIAVTGSAGKTTTKRKIGSVLLEGFGDKVLVGHGNLGTLVGVPLAFFNINLDNPSPAKSYSILPIIYLKFIYYQLFGYPYKYVVLEVSANLPGGIQEIAAIIRPSIAVITNIGISHLEHFENDIEKLKQEKLSMLKYVKKSGLIIIPKNLNISQTDSQIHYISDTGLKFADSAATAVGDWYGLDSVTIARGLNKVKNLSGRFDIINDSRQNVFIDSSYNANPESMKAVIDAVHNISSTTKDSKRIFIFGDMLELGKDTLKYHNQILDYARDKFDTIITVGKITKKLNLPLHFGSVEELSEWFLHNLPRNAIVLVKGSNGVGLSKFIKSIKSIQ